MLELKEVSYTYKGRNSPKLVLNNISCNFQLGKFYTIFGPSGSGKTTCLSLLGGLDSPTQGEIYLDNTNIKEIGYNQLRKKKVTYVFQDFHLFTYMTAIENIMLSMNITKSYRNNKAKNVAETLLQSVGLVPQDMNRIVSRLSGGQQQRVAIARALSTNANYILADEPTGNLDRENAENIISILKDLVREHNKCVIVVTHSEKIRKESDFSYSLIDGILAADSSEG